MNLMTSQYKYDGGLHANSLNCVYVFVILDQRTADLAIIEGMCIVLELFHDTTLDFFYLL